MNSESNSNIDIERLLQNSPLCSENKKATKNVAHVKFLEQILTENSADKFLTNFFTDIENETPYSYGRDMDFNLCRSLSEFKRNQFLETKKHQQRWETNQDLKELQKNIRSEYIQRSLKTQLADKRNIDLSNKFQEKAEDDFLEQKARNSISEIENETKQLKIKAQNEYKMCLLKQMDEKCKLREKEYGSYLKEREALFKQISDFEDSQIAESLRKKQNQDKQKQEMEAFRKQRTEWLQQKKLEDEAEDRKIASQVISKENEIRRIKEQKQRLFAQNQRICDRIGQENYKIEQTKKQRVQFLEDLLFEEKNALEDLKQKTDMENKFLERISMAKTSTQFAAERKAAEKYENIEAQRVLVEHIEKEAELLYLREKKEKEEKKRKFLDIREENRRVLIAKSEELATLQSAKATQRKLNGIESGRKNSLIEDERKNILKQHFKHFVGFMPPGVLKESDREYLISI